MEIFLIILSVALYFLLFSKNVKAEEKPFINNPPSLNIKPVPLINSYTTIIEYYVNKWFSDFSENQKKYLVQRMKAIYYKESGGDVGAIGDGGKSFGIGQIYLPTFNDINKRYLNNAYKHSDAFKPNEGILFSVVVFKDKYKQTSPQKPFLDRINEATRRYNGSGTKAENYKSAVIDIHNKYFI